MTSPNWKAEYAKIRPSYEAYEKKLRELVIEILMHAGIDVFQVEGRVKTPDSFEEKIQRKAGKYADPLSDMTDLVGLRVIAYYLEDVDRIVELLSGEFEVCKEHSMNKQDELAPDQFGYTSNHLVIRIGDRSERPEWAKYADISVELQVRTMSQNAWAAVHHKLSYKRVEEVPASLQRRLFRLSALFEMADEQFSAIRQATSEISTEYSDNLKQGNLAIALNAESISAYLATSTKFRRMASLAEEEFDLGVGGPLKADDEYRSTLIRIIEYLGGETIEDLDRLMPDDQTSRKVLHVLQTIRSREDRIGFDIYAFLGDMLVTAHGLNKSAFNDLYTGRWEHFLEARRMLRSLEQE
ncbi:hypothetical protein ABZ345_21395 [Lentzea sp. NPDC005914]|uniref:GTP pyrophosphokinase n=1 Tax=Lentzea sp. NPDC005914 TaxID=3154572 RepID=UPI0033C0F403